MTGINSDAGTAVNDEPRAKLELRGNCCLQQIRGDALTADEIALLEVGLEALKRFKPHPAYGEWPK